MELDKNYVQFVIGPSFLKVTTQSIWECRNAGLLKIMTRAFEILQERECLKEKWTVRINTADGPSIDPPPLDTKNYLEFDTSTESTDESKVFPDYVFGNWWHIGLKNFDDFTKDIVANSSRDNISDNRLFWMGAVQGVPQRYKFLKLCKFKPNIFCGEEMYWTDYGRTPTKFVPVKDKCRYKYLIDLTGQGVSGRLKLLPFCGRPLFIADRRLWAWSDILILKQKLHIQVSESLHDIFHALHWVESNQDKAIENSNKLLDFCVENLTFSKAARRAADMLSEAMTEKYQAR